MEELPVLTGYQLRKIRQGRGESQASFAEHFGVAQPQILRWEAMGQKNIFTKWTKHHRNPDRVKSVSKVLKRLGAI